jgi:hypothetical protein
MLRNEKRFDRALTTLRLSGRIQAEHLQELQPQVFLISSPGASIFFALNTRQCPCSHKDRLRPRSRGFTTVRHPQPRSGPCSIRMKLMLIDVETLEFGLQRCAR